MSLATLTEDVVQAALPECGLHTIEETSSSLMIRVTMANSVAFLEVVVDRQEMRLFVFLGALEGGVKPSTPIAITDGIARRTCVSASSLSAFQTGNWAAASALEVIDSESENGLRKAVGEQIGVISAIGRNVFHGDFAIVEQVEEFLDRRNAK